MQKRFKELKVGEKFRLVGKTLPGMEETAVLVKIPFMQNFYTTTGNKRNAKILNSPSKMNDKFTYVEDDEMVEVL